MTDKATDVILWTHRLRVQCMGKKENELVDITAKRAIELANQLDAMSAAIDSDRTEIASLKAEVEKLRGALDELLDWVNGERRTSDDRLAEIESMLPAGGDNGK